jgi:hypothetical protein
MKALTCRPGGNGLDDSQMQQRQTNEWNEGYKYDIDYLNRNALRSVRLRSGREGIARNVAIGDDPPSFDSRSVSSCTNCFIMVITHTFRDDIRMKNIEWYDKEG